MPEPVPAIDVETSNWFASTYPSSLFTQSLVVASQEGTSPSLLSDRGGELTLLTMTATGRTASEVERGDVPRLLADRFGLPGWRSDERGRPVPDA